jgi:coenzyme F420-dependent glucose-6-phosphate dehydrogenase
MPNAGHRPLSPSWHPHCGTTHEVAQSDDAADAVATKERQHVAHLGWKAGPEQYPPLELLDDAIAAERAGFDWLDVSDHFHPWSEDGQAGFSWTWLGAAAVKTNTLVLATGVTCPFLRYHPAVIAQAAATLGAMAPGRAYLGLGTGEALNEYAATGRWPDYPERQAMLAEAVALMREL